jgi:imidazolonepropionase
MLVTNIGQLVSLAGPARPRVGPEMLDLGIFYDAAFIVHDGLIVEMGTRREIEWKFEQSEPDGAEVLDCGGRTVTPGLVDAHTHPVWGGNRLDEFDLRASGATYEEIAAAGGGIRSSVRQTREATFEDLKATFLRHCAWFLSEGTTTIEAKSGYGLDVETEIRMLEVLNEPAALRVVPTVLAAHATPPEFDGNREGYIDLICDEILPAAAGKGATPLAEYADIFVEQNYFTPDEARRIMGRARNLGLGLRMHVDQLTNSGGAALAASLGAQTADHLEQTDAEGIDALKASSTMPVLLPASVYALGKTKYPAARAMIEAGLPVVLASDFNPGSSPCPSLPMAMNLACTQMKMRPAEALTACTVNAAHTLGRANTIGSIEAGKAADFAVWDVQDYREIIAYFGVRHLWRTYVAGRSVAR